MIYRRMYRICMHNVLIWKCCPKLFWDHLNFLGPRPISQLRVNFFGPLFAKGWGGGRSPFGPLPHATVKLLWVFIVSELIQFFFFGKKFDILIAYVIELFVWYIAGGGEILYANMLYHSGIISKFRGQDKFSNCVWPFFGPLFTRGGGAKAPFAPPSHTPLMLICVI